MACLEIRNLSFTYPEGKHKALNDISLVIEEGELVLFCGPSGSGKTTLLQQLKREISPIGERRGAISYFGQSLDLIPARQAATEIGLVFQDPENQMAMDNVWQELAFALENLGYPYADIHKRIGEMVNFFGMEEWLHRAVHELSGGQKQVINLASVLLLQPKVLLLDEPTAQLDPVAAKEFLQLVQRINEEFSTTIIISEHRLEEVFPMATKVVMMAEGKIVYQGNPRTVCQQVWQESDRRWLAYLPTLSRIYLTTQEERGKVVGRGKVQTDQTPLTVKEGKRWLSQEKAMLAPFTDHFVEHAYVNQIHRIKNDIIQKKDQSLLICKDVSFQYAKGERKILRHLDCQVSAQEILAIVGGNGAGKSTLLRLMLGLYKPQQGKVVFKQQPVSKIAEKERFRLLGYLDQNPRLYFTYETLGKCLEERAQQLDLPHPQEEIAHLLDRLRLSQSCLHQHPYDLSGGEQQKSALALVLLAKPEILLLDEPTKGLDPLSKLALGSMLQEWIGEKLTVVMVSHDLEFVAEYAQRCALLFDGQLTGTGSTGEFFSGNYFYTTLIQRVFREALPTAVTFRDVMQAWNQLESGCM